MEWLTNWDVQVLFYIQEQIRSDALTLVMRFITSLGYQGILWIGVVLILLIFKRTRKAALVAAVSLLICFIVVNLILKPAVARVRPYDAYPALVPLVDRLPDFSFPSGHTANGFAVSLVLFYMLPKRFSVWPFVLSIIISLSRLYVGVHYPTDIIAGFIIAFAISWLVWFLLVKRKKKRPQ